MTHTWINNGDGTYSCSECGCPPFRAGESCNCQVGGSAAQPEAARNRADAAEPPTIDAEAPLLPSVNDCTRGLVAILAAQRRLLKAMRKASVDNIPVFDDDGKMRVIRSWEAKHSRLKMRKDLLEGMRKTVVSLSEQAYKRELPDLVERYERMKKDLDRTRRASRRAHDQEQGEPVH